MPEHFTRAADIYGPGTRAELFTTFCSECDEEITGDEPMFYEPDGDVDEDGRTIDCSTYWCEPCGVAHGCTVPVVEDAAARREACLHRQEIDAGSWRES